MTEGRGELGSDAALPEGPYAVGLTHGQDYDGPPWTVTAADGRAIAGHVPSRAIAEAIAKAMNQAAANPRAGFVVEVDPAELAIRMCEASYGLTRPTTSAVDALAAMDEDCRYGWIKAAVAALEYVRDCISAGQAPH